MWEALIVTVALETQAGRKQQMWQNAIACNFGAADLSIRNPDRFAGRIVTLGDGPIRLVQVKSDNEIGVRTRRHSTRGTEETFIIAFVNRGRVSFEQRGRSCVLSDGMATLFAASEPYVIRHDDPADVINLTAPTSLLHSFLRHPHDHVCRSVSTRSLVGKVSRELLVGLTGAACDGQTAVPHATLQLALTSIAVLLEESGPSQPGLGTRQAAMIQRCREIIAASVAEPDLGPALLAQRMGLSVRSLHAVFHAAGTTVCADVMAKRLERSFRMLSDPGMEAMRLKEIAFATGFANPSVFSAHFRKRYGSTPSELRRKSVRPAVQRLPL